MMLHPLLRQLRLSYSCTASSSSHPFFITGALLTRRNPKQQLPMLLRLDTSTTSLFRSFSTATVPHSSTTSSSTSHSKSKSKSKPLPQPPGHYPIIGHLPYFLVGPNKNNPVDLWLQLHQETTVSDDNDDNAVETAAGSDIFQLDFGVLNKTIVMTRNPAHAQTILAHQSKDSIRTPMHSWKAIHETKGWPVGIPWAVGDAHRRNRQVLGETLLQQKNAKQYVPLVLPAANRYVDCIAAHVNPDSGKLPDDVPIALITSMFALEAVMKVVVGVDFPALTQPFNSDATDFVQAIHILFSETEVIERVWPHLHILFHSQSYQSLTRAFETLVKYPTETLQPVLQHYQQHGSLPHHVQGTVLPKLIAQHEAGDLSLDEAAHIGVQAIAAAVDTTAQTTEYVLYNLACNPDVQDTLYESIIHATGTGTGAEDDDLNVSIETYSSLKYLHAVLKESMRYTPTIGVHARTLTQDADLGDGYVLRKGQLALINYYAMTRDPRIFPSPHLFMPERFMKDRGGSAGSAGKSPLSASASTSDDSSNHDASDHTTATAAVTGKCPFGFDGAVSIEGDNDRDRQRQRLQEAKHAAHARGEAVMKNPFAALPFGHGARKCVGKAFAEMDIHLAVMALLRKYTIYYDGPPLQQIDQSLLRPVQPLHPHFRFMPRT